MNKKSVVLILAAVLFLMPVSAYAAVFRDVPETHYAYDAVNWVSNPENGAFMVGDASNNFHPSRNLNKFEAAQIYAMAAGYRHITSSLPPEERDYFNRAFERWLPFLDTMATRFSSWNRTVDREIAYLLYKGILTTEDVESFIVIEDAAEVRPLLTRQEAVVWMVRLVGQEAHAQAITMPPHTPYRDDADISPDFRRYIYHARDIGIIHGTGGYMHPTAHFTRAEMATVFYNALAETETVEERTVPDGSPVTVTGTIVNVFNETHLSIHSATGTDTFPIASNAVIMVDNTQRPVSYLRDGMTATMLVDSNRIIISLVARSQPETAQTLFYDEGIVTAVNDRSVTIRTRRLRLNGQIIEDERTFSVAFNARITRGGETADFADIQLNDSVLFGYNATVIHNIELSPAEQTVTGIVSGRITAISVIESDSGVYAELTVAVDDDTTYIFNVRQYIFDFYTLRIGTRIRVTAGNGNEATQIEILNY